MKKLLILTLISCILSSFGHFYLAKRAYQLEAGKAPVSRICSIGEKINCDSALLSPFAKVFNISLSNFGLGFNLILSLLLISIFLFRGTTGWKNTAFYLSVLISVSSIIMAGVSLIEHLFCPICWTLYALSFVTTISLFFVVRPDLLKPFSFLKQAIKEKNSYILGISILLTSLFFHINFINAFDLKSQNYLLSAMLTDWQYESPVKIKPSYILEKGQKESKIILVEFADFLCPMCKKVEPALKKFINHFPDVHFQFYVYPLDGICNSSISVQGSGLSCELSKALVCSNEQGKGWEVHDFIFENQRHFLASKGDSNQVKKLFQNMITQSKIEKQKFELCMKKASTLNKVKQSAQAGQEASINGTPSLFINGKKLMHQSNQLLILKKVYNYLKKTSE